MNTSARKLLFIAVAAIGLANSVVIRADPQDADPSPRQPLLPRAPEMSAWTISFRYKAATLPADQAARSTGPVIVDRIVSIQVQKTGNIYHQVTNWSTGGKTEAWTIGRTEFVKDRGTTAYVPLPAVGPATDDYSKGDFEDLDWINMKYFTGLKKGDQPVFIFQAKNNARPRTRREKLDIAFLSLASSPIANGNRPTGSPSSTKSAAPDKPDPKQLENEFYGETMATVVLDAKTQLPVGYDDGKTTFGYQFTSPPTDILTPPPEVLTALRRVENYVKATTVHPSPP